MFTKSKLKFERAALAVLMLVCNEDGSYRKCGQTLGRQI